jgi:hypothetical protein
VLHSEILSQQNKTKIVKQSKKSMGNSELQPCNTKILHIFSTSKTQVLQGIMQGTKGLLLYFLVLGIEP